jgi:hypothetical protein
MRGFVPFCACILIAGCAGGEKKFDYCKEMQKTGKEIEDTEVLNRELKEKMAAVPEGTDSTETQRYAIAQAMEKNDEKIKYLKTYNQTNAQNCGPAKTQSPTTPQSTY